MRNSAGRGVAGGVHRSPRATLRARTLAANSTTATAPSHPNDLQAAYQRLADLKPRMQISLVARNLDLPDTVLEAAANAEQVASQRCGSPSARDEALLLIRRRRSNWSNDELWASFC